MKVLSLLAFSVASTTVVSGRALLLQDSLRAVAKVFDQVPEPASFQTRDLDYQICDEQENTFKIESLSITPNPPQKGQKLEVALVGDLTANVGPGTLLEVKVRFMRIPILKKRLDLCDELAKVGDAPAKCPIEVGKKLWKYSVDLPESIPTGKYTADLKIKDQSGQQVFCAHATLDM